MALGIAGRSRLRHNQPVGGGSVPRSDPRSLLFYTTLSMPHRDLPALAPLLAEPQNVLIPRRTLPPAWHIGRDRWQGGSDDSVADHGLESIRGRYALLGS